MKLESMTVVLLTQLPSWCCVWGSVHYNALGSPDLCTGPGRAAELGERKRSSGSHLGLAGISQTWSCDKVAEPSVCTSFRHTLLSSLLHEIPEPIRKPRWLCSPHSEFFSETFIVLSCPQISVMATPTQSPNLRVSFKASFPEGPQNPKKNCLVPAESYATQGQLGMVTLAKL